MSSTRFRSITAVTFITSPPPPQPALVFDQLEKLSLRTTGADAKYLLQLCSRLRALNTYYELVPQLRHLDHLE